MRIYLIAHAHTAQLPDVAVDTWRLSARGIAQANTLATLSIWDEIDRVIVSSEAKAWLTVARIVEVRNIPVWIDPRFDELRRGGWIDNYAEQVAAVFAAPYAAIGAWEPVAAVWHRALNGIADLQQRFPHETLALVGHGLCLSILRAQILGDEQVDFGAWQRLGFGTYACAELHPPHLIHDFELSPHEVRQPAVHCRYTPRI